MVAVWRPPLCERPQGRGRYICPGVVAFLEVAGDSSRVSISMPPVSAASLSLQGFSVLVLEDEPLLLMVFEDVLKDLGCAQVSGARSCAEALTILRTEWVDLAVLDVHLGTHETCYEVADFLKERGIPFVFATGAMAEEVPEGYRGICVVTKPFVSAAFEAALTQALAGAGL